GCAYKPDIKNTIKYSLMRRPRPKRQHTRGQTASILMNNKNMRPFLASMLLAWLTPIIGAQPVTFTRDIAPILYKRCVSCHRADEAGPFPLVSYADAAKRASLIAQVTASRYMPPWKPEPGYGDFE